MAAVTRTKDRHDVERKRPSDNVWRKNALWTLLIFSDTTPIANVVTSRHSQTYRVDTRGRMGEGATKVYTFNISVCRSGMYVANKSHDFTVDRRYWKFRGDWCYRVTVAKLKRHSLCDRSYDLFPPSFSNTWFQFRLASPLAFHAARKNHSFTSRWEIILKCSVLYGKILMLYFTENNLRRLKFDICAAETDISACISANIADFRSHKSSDDIYVPVIRSDESFAFQLCPRYIQSVLIYDLQTRQLRKLM